MSPLINVKHLEKSFSLKKTKLSVLSDVSFSIEKGKTLALVGQSGSGKTTIAKILLRLTKYDAGEFLFDNQNVFTYSKKELFSFREKAQIIFQDPFSSLNPRMTVQDILLEPLKIHKRSLTKEQRIHTIKRLIEQVKLSKRTLQKYPYELSGGEGQRVAIARALSLNPKFLICDEALSSLDVSVGAQIIKLLKDLQEDFGLTYLFITHDLHLAKHFADTIAVLHKGKIIEKQETKTFFSQPCKEHSKELIRSILHIPQKEPVEAAPLN